MRGTRRHALGTAAATTLFSLAGLTVGVRPASGDIGAELSYTCTTPAGLKKIGLQIAGSVPASGAVGRAIEFGRIKLTANIDSADLSAFVTSQQTSETGAPGAPSSVGVTGTAKLSVSVAQGGRVTDAQWSPFPIQSAGDPHADKLKIAGTQTVPPLIPGAPEKVSLLAGALDLTLSSASGQSAADPVSCTPSGTAELASIDIGEGRTAAPSQGRAGSDGLAGVTGNAPFAQDEAGCRVLVVPPGYFNDDPALNLDSVPEKVPPGVPPPIPGAGVPQCLNLTGFTNSNKLAGAIPVASESISRRVLQSRPIGTIYVQQRGVALATPRESRATLLGFGFMPTTATVKAEQVPGQNGDRLANFRNDLYQPSATAIPDFTVEDRADRVWARANVSVLATDTSINGVPLDLGPNCRSARNALELKAFLGNDHLGKQPITLGGRYTGRLTIPPFQNCGVGEDLSPLLTATASGGNNFVSLDSSPWCDPTRGSADPNCVGDPPGPPTTPTTISIRYGGELQTTLSPFKVAIRRAGQTGAKEIVCDSVRVRFKLKKGRWISPFNAGQLSAFDTSGCVINPEGVRVTMERVSDFPSNVQVGTFRDNGEVDLNVFGFQYRVAIPERDCNMLLGDTIFTFPPTPIAGRFQLTYNNPTNQQGEPNPNAQQLSQRAHFVGPLGGVLKNNCGPPFNFSTTFPTIPAVDATWPTSTLESDPPLNISRP